MSMLVGLSEIPSNDRTNQVQSRQIEAPFIGLTDAGHGRWASRVRAPEIGA